MIIIVDLQMALEGSHKTHGILVGVRVRALHLDIDTEDCGDQR